ncbi:MAG: Ig-like domain-containing protein, partial [Coriobacteriales bacterium]
MYERRLATIWPALATLLFASLLLVAAALAGPVEWAHADGGLSVVESAPEANETKAPTSGRYWVQFSKAVTPVSANKSYVTLKGPDGIAVSKKNCKIHMPDFELYFEYRQYIYLDVKNLKPNTTYTIHIAAGVTAKNGVDTLTEPVEITFTTAKKGQKATTLAKPTAVQGGTGNGNGTGQGAVSSSSSSSSSASTTSSSASSSSSAAAAGSSSGSGGGVPALVWVLVVLVVAVVLVLSAVRRARRNTSGAERKTNTAERKTG